MIEHAQDSNHIVRQAYDGLARGDLPIFLNLLAPDVQWRESPGLSLTGRTYNTRDSVVDDVLKPFIAQIPDLGVTPDEIFATDGEIVVVLGRYTGTAIATSHPIDIPFTHVWRLHHGTAVGVTQYTDTALLNQALNPPLPALR
jgi:ketosteroid isomerase-like protein